MANKQEIKHHIKAVQQTRKITNAMYLISSAAIKKMMPQVDYNRRYLDHIQAAMRDILANTGGYEHQYLKADYQGLPTYIVITGDKGLAGGYNSEILRFADQEIKEREKVRIISLGNTGTRYYHQTSHELVSATNGSSVAPSLNLARHLSQDIFRDYEAGTTQEIRLIYTQYLNTHTCQPTIKQLLPLNIQDFREENKSLKTEMIYHPSAAELFKLLVPQYTTGLIYAALMQAYASEHCVRTESMQSATRNADELLKKLNIRYNIARQSAITQELSEINNSAPYGGSRKVNNEGR